ncbi:xanthine dehydrogenase molybdopterin binding subunit [Acinetobacter seifertii]|uniref:Xanthine dehydrogenase molybdopterin binding subunit n=1 Tax=Acinetobacter seifertii TaxID=1530123 RepID=A0ABX8L6Z8_9GAMM|nr:xanthine dehydrogenase molybdopterin binding subunit [Acinetobacter seifertii]QXB45988.1 xanthine dehydrogenase molybdopterin binding subunit [Acinetobacter seifertii]
MNQTIDLNISKKSAKAGDSIPHESAHLHVTGQATYIDDLPELENTMHLAVGFSSCAKGKIIKFDLDAVRQADGVHAVFSAKDIEVENNWGPIVKDDPIFAEEQVEFYGQALFVVVANSYQQARQAVRLAKIEYVPETPILTIQDAIEKESWVLPPVEFSHGEVEQAFQNAAHQLSGAIELGGQEHFYLEGQISYAIPQENQSLKVYCSTQHPTEMQLLICHALGMNMHQVSVESRRMGGGFGGKESQSAQWACIASLAAQKTGRPCKLRLDRDDDMSATGKRHGFAYEWSVAFDDSGILQGLKVQLASNCGFSADLSGPVNERAICHIGNAYYLNAVELRNLRCKTNTVSNTAYRGFGGPQGMFVIENIIDDIARYLGCDPVEIRQRNFFAEQPGAGRDRMHYGAEVRDNVAPKLVAELLQSSDYAKRKQSIHVFNQNNDIIKRGIALTPLVFGISFNAVHYNQAGALVYVYMDGTVSITHGGTEMGQGLYTKVRQVAAHELGLPIDSIRLIATDTSRVPNTSATAASSGADLNGKAVQNACIKIRERLAKLAAEISQSEAEQVQFEDSIVKTANDHSWTFPDLVQRAYMARVQLWDSGFYKTPEIHYDQVNHLGRPFFYYAYGAAVSEVAIDTLTGEMKVLRADILHDVGRSINPAIDIGQIEGGFVQGMGWLTTEELYWQPQGPHIGRLFTHAPSTYKIPTSVDIPHIFNVKLFDNQNQADTIYRSKAVGEPPFMLALSVFSAIRQAVQAAIPENAPLVLNAPATAEEILRAIAIGRGQALADRPQAKM